MNPVLAMLGRRLRLAVIGGGPGSFIGPVHRTAARLDDRFEIVAGVLSGDPERSRAAARDLGIQVLVIKRPTAIDDLTQVSTPAEVLDFLESGRLDTNPG